MKPLAFLLAAALCAVTGTATAAEPATPQMAATAAVVPLYPNAALKRKHTGWVVVRYSVNAAGRAENIEVTSSEPAGVFDRAVRRAVRQSRYQVPMIAGAPGSIDGQYQKFVFEIDEQIPGRYAGVRP
ncbi:MAG: energy transducer TonB [Cellvibrionales bacterium]|nr:energy transducer TonB [Cellvibrionales bacterium]